MEWKRAEGAEAKVASMDATLRSYGFRPLTPDEMPSGKATP